MVAISKGAIYIHSAPDALRPHVEWAIGSTLGWPVTIDWQTQPVLAGSWRGEISWSGPSGMGAAIASALRGWEHLRYEVTEDATAEFDGGRWMHTPDLGIFYAQTDTVGNIVVPENRIRSAMETAGSNPVDLHRELNLALGRAWDAELEPFRSCQDLNPVIWLHRVG